MELEEALELVIAILQLSVIVAPIAVGQRFYQKWVARRRVTYSAINPEIK
jgi:hypothetical protein